MALLTSAFSIYVLQQNAYAETPGRTNDSACLKPGETSLFPYGFFCGSDGNYYDPVQVNETAGVSSPANSGDSSEEKNFTVPYGTTSLSMTMAYANSGPAKSDYANPGIMPWVTVASPTVGVVTGISADRGGVGNRACPGATTSSPGVVYGQSSYGGDAPYPANADVSPYGYVGSSGQVNCDVGGKMVYWPNQSTSTSHSYTFTINIASGSEGSKICVRGNMSVYYSSNLGKSEFGKYGLFPTSGTNYSDDNSVASHLAKQSQRRCYTIASNPKPIGHLTISGDCKTYKVDGYDPSSSNSRVSYKIIRNGTSTEIPEGNTTSRYDTSNRTNPSLFRVNREYALKIKDLNNGLWYSVDTQTLGGNCGGGGGCGTSGQPACPSTKTQPLCNKFIATSLRGGAGLDNHTFYRFTLFHDNTPHYSAGPRNSSPPPRVDENDNRNFATMSNNDDGSGADMVVFKHSYTQDDKGYSFDFPSPKGANRLLYVESWTHDSDNDTWTYSGGATKIVQAQNCYLATCSIDSIQAVEDVPGDPSQPNPAKAGGLVRVTGTITNASSTDPNQPIPFPGDHLYLRGKAPDYNTILYDVGTSFEGTYNFAFNVSARSVVGQTVLDTQLDYGSAFTLSQCGGGTISAYGPFQLTPTAGFGSTNWENPTSISYNGHVAATAVPNPPGRIPATASLTLTKNGSTVQSGGGASNFNDKDYGPSTYNPTSIAAGDTYCVSMEVYPATGWIGPGDDISNPAGATSSSNCPQVHNEPYVHAFGSDVFAGGGFGSNCVNTGKGIETYLRTTGNAGAGILPAGSGVQLGALAIGPSEGFNSALLRGNSPTGPTGLSFANTVNTGGGGSTAKTGGSLGGNHCIHDYYRNKVASTVTNTAATNVTSLPTDNSTRYTRSITLGAMNIPLGTKKTIYVDGDVYITGNIAYSTDYQTIDNIPSLTIVSKGGSIYIDNDVTQLDGTYVSQPSDENGGSNNGTGGNIYTCATASSPVAYTNVLDSCNNQLVINGSFVGQHVFLLRSFGSLRNSQSGERLSAGARTCESQEGSQQTNNGDCAAEIFNYSPEAYFGQKNTSTQSGPTTGIFDYITSLAPIL